MYLYKVMHNRTGRTYVGLSRHTPHKSVELKFKFTEKEEGLPPLERDILNFGLDYFSIIPICELNNESKAKKKANHLISRLEVPYNQFYFEVFD